MNEQERILTIFLRLQKGEHVSKKALADEFSMSEKTIQRDFSFLKHFISTSHLVGGEITYDAKTKKHYLLGKSVFNKREILVISKILLENRAFNIAENNALLDGLLALLPKQEQKEVEQIIASEKLNYAPLHDQQNRIDKIWEFSEYIRKETMISFDYVSPRREGTKKHTLLPVALYYDGHYFYLKGYDLAYQDYIDYRLDRVIEWQKSQEKKPNIPHARKFRDGDVRNYKVDAFTGQNITFRVFYTQDPAILLDQFPKSKIIKQTDKGCEIEIVSQNTLGLKRYLISQLDALTILSPQSLIDDIKETLNSIQRNYD